MGQGCLQLGTLEFLGLMLQGRGDLGIYSKQHIKTLWVSGETGVHYMAIVLGSSSQLRRQKKIGQSTPKKSKANKDLEENESVVAR